MTDPIPVSIALVRKPTGELLWVWDGEWDCFALPMSKLKKGDHVVELPEHAALRAAGRALGVPVRIGQAVHLDPELFVSGRDLASRHYRYDVYRAEPHPDFATRVDIRVPHLWLAPHTALRSEPNSYDPLSPSCRWVVATLAGKGYLPGRSQYTAVLVLHRDHNGRRQFLLRREPGWGYALPTKRRAPDESYLAASHRVARDELGVDPGELGLSAGHETVTAQDESRSEHVVTFYCHGVFEGSVPAGTKFDSAAPLVWVDATAIAAGSVKGPVAVDGQPAPDGVVSPTARHILQDRGHVPFLGSDVG